MRERKSVRSDKYQHVILEISCPEEMLSAFPNEESIYKRLNPFKANDEIADLEDQLKKEFWRIVETQLTPRQKDVIRLIADGYTQIEVAKILNVNQSSITKCLIASTVIIEAKTGEATTIGELFNHQREFWILAMGNDGQMKKRRVIGIMHNGQQPVFTLQTISGKQITATGNHPFWAEKWVNLNDICVGDCVGIAINGDVVWEKVVSIKEAGTEDVYDLTVEEDHNFVANDFIVHNSINGNVDYKAGKKSYGGSRRRLRKLIDEDDKIQKILKKIAALRDENWT